MVLQHRIARPVTHLERSRRMYCEGLGWAVLGGFEDHGGFDGVMVGPPEAAFHFELTHCRTPPVAPSPTPEDLVVVYVPLPDEWRARCGALVAAGFREVAAFNPFWSRAGRTFADADGYRVVICSEPWQERP